MIEAVAEYIYEKKGRRFRATTSAPGIVMHRKKHPEMWKCVGAPKMKQKSVSKSRKGLKTSAGRLTTSWIYIPEKLRNNVTRNSKTMQRQFLRS